MRWHSHSLLVVVLLLVAGLSVVGTGSVAAQQSADLVVATDGSGDYSSIQNAVDNASNTARIEIKSGVYEESATIDKNVTIAAPDGATLTPSPSGSDFSGISITEHAAPHISGLDIDGFDVSINAGRAGATDPTNGDWKVTNISINGNNEQYSSGIDASETSGNWTIKSIKIKNTDYGISFSSSTSNITIRDVKITDIDSGITGYSTTGDWLIQNATVRNATDKGISIDHSIGSWEITSSKIQNISGDGIDAYQTDGGVISDVYINNISDENGINIVESAGDWIIKNAIIKNVDKDSGINAYNTNQSGTSKIKNVTIRNIKYGINFADSKGDVQISGATIQNTRSGEFNHGIVFSESTSNWTITDAKIKNISGDGISGYKQPESSQATIRNVTISNTQNNGAGFYNSAGNWEIINSHIFNSNWSGVEASNSSSDWNINNTTIESADDWLIRAVEGAGTWEVHESKLVAAEDAINATGSLEGNASHNHWDASDGPSGDYNGSGSAAVGNVSVIPFYTDVQLTNLSSEIGEDDSGDSGSGYVDVDPSELTGSGTETDPYVITNASELQAMEDDLDAHYELGSDIDASSTVQWNDGKGFDPVGDGSGDFKGSFDGNEYNISELTINRGSSAEEAGVFGEVDSALIESVHLDSVTIAGNNSVGALAGYLEEDVMIQNASMSGSVSGRTETGGLIGSNTDSTVKFASAKGTVTGSDQIGGLVGQNVGGVVTRSSSQAAVTATGEEQGGDSARGGGLVGGNFNDGIINKSYATGNVTGGKAGGITGENYDGSRVIKTYATGNVDGRNEQSTGGVSGENFKSCPFQSEQSCEGFEASIITDSYWDTETTGQSTSAGNATGLTTAQMTGETAETNMSGLNFNSVWQTQPDGYPVLTQETSISDGGTTVPPEIRGDVSDEQYAAVLDGDDTLAASNLADAINGWADNGKVNGTDIGAFELSKLINYWADS